MQDEEKELGEILFSGLGSQLEGCTIRKEKKQVCARESVLLQALLFRYLWTMKGEMASG